MMAIGQVFLCCSSNELIRTKVLICTHLIGVKVENEPLVGIFPVKLLYDKSLDSTMIMVSGYRQNNTTMHLDL